MRAPDAFSRATPSALSSRIFGAIGGTIGGVIGAVLVAAVVVGARPASAERPPRSYIPAAVQLELRQAEARFETALAQDCATDKCFSNGCVYVSHTSTDLPRDTALPGLEGEQGPGSVPTQDTLTEIRCAFSNERSVNAKDVASLARRLEQRLSRGWLRVVVTTNELAPVPRRLSDALNPPEDPAADDDKKDRQQEDAAEDAAAPPPPPPPPPPAEPAALGAEEMARDLWETMLPHASWMTAILLLTLATLALIWAGRRLGAPSLDEKLLLHQLSQEQPAPPAATAEPETPAPAPTMSPEDADFVRSQEELWTGRLSSASTDSDQIMADLLQEWLRAGNFPMLARALLVFGDRVASALATDADLAMKKLEFAAYFRDVDEAELPSRTEFFRRLNQHAMASALLAQDDVKPYRTLREDFGSSGVVDLMEQLPPRGAALLFALMPRDSQSDVARLMPAALRVSTAEQLLASTRMARAESDFIFQSIGAVRDGRPLPPPPSVAVTDRGPAIDGATALSVLMSHFPREQRAQLLQQAVVKSGGNAPRWFEDILFGAMLDRLDAEQRQDMLLEVDIRGLAAWIGQQEQEWQRTFTASLSASLQAALRTNGAFASRDEALRHARVGHDELTRALKIQYAKERVTFLQLAA